MHNILRELKIKLAQRVMRAGYMVARRASAWMTQLVLSRPPEVVARMEQKKGLT